MKLKDFEEFEPIKFSDLKKLCIFGLYPFFWIISMIYTKYFSGLIAQYGRPNMSDAQFRLLMNIVHLEGRLEGINTIKRKLEGTREAHRFDMEFFNVHKKLTEITGNLPPEAFKSKLFMN